MKYKGGKSWYDNVAQEWKYQPRIYTDFYCSLSEWANLGNGRDNFMYQVRSAIVDLTDIEPNESPSINDEYSTKRTLNNGLVVNMLSFDRTGRRDGLDTEIKSANIIKYAIKLITHRNAEVEFFSWKGTIDHIEIVFPKMQMPNIIVLVDEYSMSSTNYTLIKCIDAIYEVLKAKTTEWYDKYLHSYFNNKYDMIFYISREDSNSNYLWAKNIWMWKDRLYLVGNRNYDRYGKITYYKVAPTYK